MISRKLKKGILGFSLLVNLPVLYEAPLIAQFTYEQRLNELWILWGAGFGLAFGLVFIAPLWKKIPTDTENGFHLFRYEGSAARGLYYFRAVFLGLIIVPLIATLNLHSFATLFSLGSGISQALVIIIVCGVLIFTTTLNTMERRFRMDSIVGILSMLAIAFLALYWLFQPAETNKLVQHAGAQALFPENTISIIMVLGFHWMLTGIFDFPDMEGQKLLHAREKGTMKQFLLLILLTMVSQVFIYILGLKAVVNNSFVSNSVKGEALLGNFIAQHPMALRVIFLGLLFFSFISVLKNLQLWCGQLLQPILPKQIKNRSHLPGMIMFGAALAFWSWHTAGLWSVARYLLIISSGVGPVFLLRWYWNRITAGVQWIAMVFALVIGNVYEFLYSYSHIFAASIDSFSKHTGLSLYLTEVLICGVLTTMIWLVSAMVISPTGVSKWKNFQSATGAIQQLKSPSNWILFFLLSALLLATKNLAWQLGKSGPWHIALFIWLLLVWLIWYTQRFSLKKN